MLNLGKESWVPGLYPLKLLGLVKTNTAEEQYSELTCDLMQMDTGGDLPESKQTQNLGSSPVNLQLSPNFGHICGWFLRRAKAMLQIQVRNTLSTISHQWICWKGICPNSSVLKSGEQETSAKKDVFRKHNQSAKQAGSMWWETDNVIPDKKQQIDTMSKPEHNGITV